MPFMLAPAHWRPSAADHFGGVSCEAVQPIPILARETLVPGRHRGSREPVETREDQRDAGRLRHPNEHSINPNRRTTMVTSSTNGRARKSLAEQIDRLDSILDGLAENLN